MSYGKGWCLAEPAFSGSSVRLRERAFLFSVLLVVLACWHDHGGLAALSLVVLGGGIFFALHDAGKRQDRVVDVGDPEVGVDVARHPDIAVAHQYLDDLNR